MSMNLDINSGTFTSFCEEMELIIEETIKSYLQIFGVKSKEEIPQFLKSKESENENICFKIIFQQTAWRCYDCVKTRDVLFCQECWAQIKDKHKDHDFVCLPNEIGFCSCGDHNCMEKQNFCPKHKGIIESDSDIKKYINDCLGEDLHQKIKNATEILFNKMIIFFVGSIGDGKTRYEYFTEVVSKFLDCLALLCENSKACTHIIAELMLKKYPNKLKHECLDINGQSGKIIKKSIFSHDCTCHFLRFVLEFWPGNKLRLLIKLLDNYNLRKMIGVYYFLFYDVLIKNCINDFDNIKGIIVFNDSLKLAINIPGLIDKVYENMNEIFKIHFNIYKYFDYILAKNLDKLSINDRYDYLSNLFMKLQKLTFNLLKPVSYSYLSNNSNIIFKLIDIAAYFQNLNSIKFFRYPPGTNFDEQFYKPLLDSENIFLGIISNFFSFFNFEDNILVKDVFTYFSKAILKKIKKKLDYNEYSFHITLFRAFSIFLNRFCYYQANKFNSDIFSCVQEVPKLMPDFKKCSQIMIKGIYKIFGFIAGCGVDIFKDYKKDIYKFEQSYFFNPQFIYRDFCLLKYLLSFKENEIFFKFSQILQLSEVDYSSVYLEEITKDGYISESRVNENSDKLKLSSKVMLIILKFSRNNTCFLWNLSHGYNIMKYNKLRDKLIDDILSKDINNYLELTKELIINQILIKKNSAFLSEITDKIYLTLYNFFGEKIIKDIIISLTVQTLSKEGETKFSLKEEVWKSVDLNYIIYPEFISEIEEYIENFKNQIIPVFNIYFYSLNKFESKLIEETIAQFYLVEGNMDFLSKLLLYILTFKDIKLLKENFLKISLDFLSTFLNIDNKSKSFLSLKETLKNDKITKLLENNDLSDKSPNSYCKYIAQKILGEKISFPNNKLMDFQILSKEGENPSEEGPKEILEKNNEEVITDPVNSTSNKNLNKQKEAKEKEKENQKPFDQKDYKSPFPVPGYEPFENLWEFICDLKEEKEKPQNINYTAGVRSLLEIQKKRQTISAPNPNDINNPNGKRPIKNNINNNAQKDKNVANNNKNMNNVKEVKKEKKIEDKKNINKKNSENITKKDKNIKENNLNKNKEKEKKFKENNNKDMNKIDEERKNNDIDKYLNKDIIKKD